MPSNKDFDFHLTVGGVELPEYEKDGECFVESCLFTPYSYNMKVEEEVGDEKEVQSWPVTPYQLKITASASGPQYYYRVYVDGNHVKSCSIHPGETRVVGGFRDGNQLKEFLFSLPRFPKDETDRIDPEMRSKVGTVEILCYNAQLRNTKMTTRTRKLQYLQATKKDATYVTHGKYSMITTKAGRPIRVKSSRKRTDFWYVQDLRTKLSIKYVTKDTLTEMGFDIKPVPFLDETDPAVGSRQSLVSSNSRSSTQTNSQMNSKSELSAVKLEPLHIESSNEIIVVD